MTYTKLIIIILSLFLMQTDTALATQQTQKPITHQKKIQKPWYKNTRNMLLVSGAAMAAILTGATVRYGLPINEQHKRKELAKEILGQTDDESLSALIDKHEKKIDSDPIIFIVAHAKATEFELPTLSPQKRKHEVHEFHNNIYEILTNYIKNNSKEELKSGLDILSKITMKEFKEVYYTHHIQNMITEKLNKK